MSLTEQKIPVLDSGYTQLIESWGSDERIIETARMSTSGSFKGWGGDHKTGCAYDPYTPRHCDSNCDLTKPGDEKLLAYLWKNGHISPFECCGLTIEMQAPLFVFRQLFRHRSLSPNEYSGRYTEMLNVSYIPTIDRLMLGSDGKNKQAGTIKNADVLTVENAQVFRDKLEAIYRASQEVYEWALKSGVPKELARIPLTVGGYSRARISGNLRNWLHCIDLRSDFSEHGPEAQWETRMFVNPVGDVVKSRFPRTWKLFTNDK